MKNKKTEKDFDLYLPIYIQICELIKMRIFRKEYLPGSFVPSTRRLAIELCVTTNTLQIVYKRLVRDGYLIVIRGVGFKVTDDIRKINKLQTKAIHYQLEKLDQYMKSLEFTNEEICKIFNEYMKK